MANTAPRPGITFDQVAATADTLLGKGITPTIQAIRDAIGGSPNTVQKHLAVWREAIPKSNAEAPTLPANLAAAFNAEIVRATAEARSEVETKLVQSQKEASDLATAGEALESERDDLADQVSSLTAAHNTLTGKSEEQANEIVRLATERERERVTGEKGRVELAQALNKIESQAEKLADQSAAIDRLATAHAADLERLTTANNAEVLARIATEKAAAVLQARIDALAEKLAAQTEVIDRLTAANAAETQGRTVAEKNAAVLQAQLDASQEQTEAVKARECKLDIELEKERQVAEQARGEGKELHDKIENQAGKLAEQANTIGNLEKEITRLKASQV